MDISKWTVTDVEKWFIKNRFGIAVYGAFRNKWKIDGEKLLKLNRGKIEFICRRACPQETDRVMAAVLSLQDSHSQHMQHMDHVERKCKARKLRKLRQQKKKQSANSSTSKHRKSNKKIIDYDISHSGEKWTEQLLREAWHLVLPPRNKDYKSIAMLLKRTETAVLTKMNLIRRAIYENPELEQELMNPLVKCKYSLIEIVKQQNKREKEEYQEARLKQKGNAE